MKIIAYKTIKKTGKYALDITYHKNNDPKDPNSNVLIIHHCIPTNFGSSSIVDLGDAQHPLQEHGRYWVIIHTTTQGHHITLQATAAAISTTKHIEDILKARFHPGNTPQAPE